MYQHASHAGKHALTLEESLDIITGQKLL